MDKLVDASQTEKVFEIASVYKEVFGSEPWNEGYKCPECVEDNIYPLSFTQKLCPKCLALGKKVELLEFWPLLQVVCDFRNEMLKTGAICCVAQDQDKIVGFAWAYEMLVNEKTDEYLDSPGLAKIIIWRKHLYIDEVAVLPNYRGKGIGKNLVRRLCSSNGFLPILLRTKNNSPAYNMFLGLGGKVVLNITRERVIMAINPQ